MLYFSPDSEHYRGALQYLYDYSQNQYPVLSTNGKLQIEYNSDEIKTLISDPGNARVFYTTTSDYIYMQIDLVTHILFPSYVELGTLKGGSPPITLEF